MSYENYLKRLDEICENLDRLREPISKNKREPGPYPYYGASGIVDHVADYIFDEDLLLVSEDGANLLDRTYPIAFSISGKNWVNNHAHVLRFLDKVSQRLIEYYLNSIKLDPWVSGMAQPKLNQRNLNSIPVPFPPLPEQKRIVGILDEAFEAIDQAKANIERNIENAEELFQSKLNEIFSQRGEGWEEKRLEEVCENLDRMREPISKKNREEGPYPYYGASGIVDYVADYIFDEDLLLVSEDGANLLARTYPIAFSISGKNWVNNHAHVLRFENMASQRFIEYYLNSIKLDPWVSGMAQPKLNQRNLHSIPVPFPPLEDQKKVVSGLDVLKNDVEAITEAYKNKINGLEELKKSILQKAFSGELTANEHVAA
ncbi:restriction endonuclease subunit S [Rhodohalobacter barkolensis]|nr:restriction endonuclease subunit S [Rhodohalobacter barkolensis]